jgi:hypothetical protein
MLQTVILDVAIGLVFVFLLASLLCSLLQEAYASTLNRRQTLLSEAIDRLLAGQTIPDLTNDRVKLTEKVKAHPLIKNLGRTDTTAPSYIPSSQFASALISTLKDTVHTSAQRDVSIASSIEGLPSGELKRILQTFLTDSRGEIGGLTKRIEGWYDDFMERVSGWYKREVRKTMFIIGFLVAIALNIDTFLIGRALWNEPALRAAVVKSAQSLTDADLKTTKESEVIAKLKAPNLPIGWPDPNFSQFSDIWSIASIIKIVGFLLTAAAVSMGAQFWFNGLQKLLDLRSAGAAPTRQPAPAAVAGSSAALTSTSTPNAADPNVALAPNNFESSMLSADDIRDIQKSLGLSTVALTGQLDAQTRHLISQYQERAGRTPDGYLTMFLVDRILASAK